MVLRNEPHEMYTFVNIWANLKKPGLEDETLGNLKNLIPDK